jgi:hypothetical protein
VLGDVTEVHAAHGPGDTVHLTLRHESGASSTAALTLTAPAAAAGVAVEFRGGHGIAGYPDGLLGPATDSLARAVDALTSAIAGPLDTSGTPGTPGTSGAPHPCDARFGARVTEILAAAEAALG